MNTRALARLFEVAGERYPDVKYEIKITLLEIYNEKIQDLLGEKGRVLKAVQGQYGMEVQDLTSGEAHAQCSEHHSARFEPLLDLTCCAHSFLWSALLPRSSPLAQHGVRGQRSRGVRHSEAWLEESLSGRNEHERCVVSFAFDSQRLRHGAQQHHGQRHHGQAALDRSGWIRARRPIRRGGRCDEGGSGDQSGQTDAQRTNCTVCDACYCHPCLTPVLCLSQHRPVAVRAR